MTARPARQVAVVGLGYFSRFHLDAWQRDTRSRIVAVCDTDGERARAAAEMTGAAPFTDAAEMLDRVQPEIVDIVAPPATHATLVRAALAPDRLIVCQKPFAESFAEARALLEEANAAGTRIVIHENFRFQPWHRRIHELITSGALGEIWSARFALRPGDGRGKRAYLDRQPFFQAMPRFLIRETGVHFIDLFRFFFGPIMWVTAELRQLNPVIAGEDAGFLLMGHRSGTRSLFEGNRLADHVASDPRLTMGEMEFVGEAGTLLLDGEGRIRVRDFGSAVWRDIPLGRPVDRENFGGGCVAALIRHVLDALERDEPMENELAEYLQVMEACEAAYRSAETGCRVDLTA